MAVGGDITEVRWKHPTLGEGVLFPKSNEGNTFFTGGNISSSDENMIDGGGNLIRSINKRRGFFNVLCSHDMNTAKEFEKMIALSGSPVEAEWTFSIINGSVYAGKGVPVDIAEANINDSTFQLRVEGGLFKQIV